GSVRERRDSTSDLSPGSPSPAQVGFDRTGRTVIVTERATNRMDTYRVGRQGRLGGPRVHRPAGPPPIGFAVSKRNTLLVSEAGDGGGASSYRVRADGSLQPGRSNGLAGPRA